MMLNTTAGLIRTVSRSSVFDEVLKMYREDLSVSVLSEHPLQI